MRTWARHNHEAFERDVLRDFCRAAFQLSEQFARFATTGTISFAVLRNMIGAPLNKGLLWRLKDKAHHIFANDGETRPAGLLLDWTLGYIFHESLKLMEDAHQRQYYAPRLENLADFTHYPELTARMRVLRDIQGQTMESLGREIARLETLLLQSRGLFCLYFAGRADHRPLARFLHDNNDLARAIFADDYDCLVRSVYGDEPERMPLEAAHSLLESARSAAAALAVEEALARNPRSPDALALRGEINAQSGRAAAPAAQQQRAIHEETP